MKVAYTALHYGSDYLESAIRSVIEHVDVYWVLYSDVGSHGHRTDKRNPDTRDQLLEIAARAAGDKLGWIDGRWDYEGQQRETILEVAGDADVILVLDADEVWPLDTVEAVVHEGGSWMGTFEQRKNGGVSRVRVPMIHYWRSFHRAVLRDPAFPVRVLFPKVKNTEEWTANLKPISHFGYAQRPEIVKYKLETHGHKGEWRKDVDWFNDVFMANRQTDCHPVGSEYWNPETVNPWDYLPEFMKQHPYANMDVIE